MRHFCNNLVELIDFIALVVLRAPDNFPKYEWRPSDQQLDLDRAFQELRHGLNCAAKEVGESPSIATARSMLEEACMHYREGRTNPGAWKLQEMSRLLEGT